MLNTLKTLSIGNIALKQLYVGGVLAWQESSSYTNQVSISIDSSKNIYNGAGYKDGYRLSSSGAEKERTYSTVTGFIPTKSGDIIEIQGYKWYDTASATNYFCAYDKDFKFIGAIVAKGTTYTSNPTSNITGDDEKAIITVANNSNIAYVRISVYEESNGNLTGANLIVTVNEEIN